MWKKVGCFALMLAGFVLSQVGDEMSKKQEKEEIEKEVEKNIMEKLRNDKG